MVEIRTLPVGCAERRRDSACGRCGARAFSVCASLEGDDLARLDALADRINVEPGSALTFEGEPARNLFNITSGSVRVFKLLPDGRRQIVGFLFAGDFLGLATGETFVYSAEAIEPVTACRFKKAEYRQLIRDCPTLESALLERASHELVAAQNQMLLLGRKTALERIATFLLNLPAQDPARPGPAGHVRLPMSRSEIADYLGLTIETVSRVFTKLKTQGVIRFETLNEVVVLKPRELRALAEGPES